MTEYDVTPYIPDIDYYIRWLINWYDGFLTTNPLFVQIVTGLTGWAVLSPFEIWERVKKWRRKDGLL